MLGRENASESGLGYAAALGGLGETVAAIAVANPFGDVVGAGWLGPGRRTQRGCAAGG